MSTISNERLEEITNDKMINQGSEFAQMARELLTLRKERERAEPVAYIIQDKYHREKGDEGYLSRVHASRYIPGDDIFKDGVVCTPLFKEAPPAPSIADDSLPYDPQIAEYEQMMEAEQAQADTTAQQFELLAGKAVGGSEGFECTPVADLYELMTKCGECYDYTTSAKVAADWIKEGYSAREYVKLDRLQEALVFATPEPCK
ncbi:hypothetical protein PN553_004462 [Cronobacter sakazakii]|nr:hypothetical protein [Cronobacter sakazakii]EKK5218394.1 hypothetical protein [Cronobacter sakazakii]